MGFRTACLAAALALAAAPAWGADDDGFAIRPRATVQYDAAAVDGSFPPGAHLTSGGNFRRLRLGVSGQFSRNWYFEFIPKFESSSIHYVPLNTAYVQYDGLAPVHLRFGAYAPPANFEDTESSTDLTFLERPQSADLARNVGGGTGRTAASILYYDDSYFASLSYAGGNVDDTPLRQQSVVGRVAWRFFHDGANNLVVGADVTRLLAMPDFGAPPTVRFRAKPELSVLTLDSRLIDTGTIRASGETEWGLEAAGNLGDLYGHGGLFHFLVARPGLADAAFAGWYMQASWVLTGEAKRWRGDRGAYAAPRPDHPLFGGDGAGALELAARYSVLDLDDHAGVAGAPAPAGGVRGGEQRIAALGLNWYPGGLIRFMLDYQHVEVARLSAGGGNLGGHFDTLALRSQLNL